MGQARQGRRLALASAAISALLIGGLVVLRPWPLPSWLASSGDVRNAASGVAPAAPTVSVVAGDGQVSASWASAAATDYRADIAAEGGGTPLSCREVATLSANRFGCTFGGLTNGVRYLVSLRPGRATAGSAPLRMVPVVPRPQVLRGTDALLWLDASNYASIRAQDGNPARIGSAVAVLRDQSPRHQDAAQTVTARQPVIGQLGSLPALVTKGTQFLTVDGPGLPVGSTAVTVFVVAAMDDPEPADSCFRNLMGWGDRLAGHARILHKGCQDGFAYAETYDTYTLQHPTRVWPVARAAVVTARFQPGGTEMRVNGVVSYTWAAAADLRQTGNAAGVPLVGAAPWSTDAGWLGRIGEVIVIGRAVTAQETASVESYLAAKWQVTVAS